DRAAVMALCEGQDLVVHSGALSSPWGRYEDFYRANVIGTESVLAGCQAQGGARLVHVSTPSLYFDGREAWNLHEDSPLPRPRTSYIATKRIAEERVGEAVSEGLEAIILRPRGLYGPGDPAIFPRIVAALEAGRLPILGRGDNLADITYIDNVVDALLCAARAGPEAVGKIYNITNGDPVPLWPLVDRLADELRLARPRWRLPVPVALVVAWLLEVLHSTVVRGGEPRMTRYSVAVLARTITLDIGAARRELGYAPRVTTLEGFERYLTWLKSQRAG
ncbi:MAG: NAD-dependent epimerase/dehydratase family protein, partial [Planctomycetota bacterium]|nr:NAD-dependent epimerase/dehydratase family protein [Planctomycetota bacterium]